MPKPGPSSPANVASETESELEELRREIDATDRAILERLNERARLVEAVGRWKRSQGRAVYTAARERDLVAALARANPGPFPNEGLAPVFREIISATRSLEERVRVAFLGPEGTFSHLAVRQQFGTLADLCPVGSIPEVFAAVERRKAGLGIVPVENTTEGVVTACLDAFLESDVSICGEVVLRVSHQLMSRATRLEEIRKVVSHPQPLAQCRGWLDRHLPGIERMEVASTAAAAAVAVREEGVAAIGSTIAAEVNGLQILEPCIEDRADNTTRFLLIGGVAPQPSGNDLTSVIYTVRKDQPGTLHRLLEPFARYRVNLTSMQSRPLKNKPWEYVFFVDLEGHRDEERVAKAIAEAEAVSHYCKVIGSFPRAAAQPGQEGGEG
jgi:chorismate mutase/prephenate dehydratase